MRRLVAGAAASRCPSWRTVMVAVLCAFMAFAPGLAEARAGMGSSMGSRGARSWSGNGAQTLQRSVTPRATPSQPYGAPQPAPSIAPYGYAGGGFMSRHPFMSGLIGGFIGAGIAGMIFGHAAWMGEISPFGSLFGLLLQFALIGGLIALAVGALRRRASYAFAGGQGLSGVGLYPRMPGSAAPISRDPIEILIGAADFNAWTGILTGVQDAWTRGDLAALRRHVTPEMLGYFSEELSRNASEGVVNRVERVTLLKGDLEEAWSEGGLEYATARLRWSALDYLVRPALPGPGAHEVVVSGDPVHPVEATEVWTFARRPGGAWLLSATQQV